MNTAGRRRKQAVGGWKNIDPVRRPRYAKTSEAKAAERLAATIATERRMNSAKKK